MTKQAEKIAEGLEEAVEMAGENLFALFDGANGQEKSNACAELAAWLYCYSRAFGFDNAAFSDAIKLAQEIIERGIPAPQVAAGVKPLEWSEIEIDRGDGSTDAIGEWEAPSIGGTYAINISTCGDMHAPWEVFGVDDGKIGNFETLADAKAAAQADYERRVLSCLDFSPLSASEKED